MVNRRGGGVSCLPHPGLRDGGDSTPLLETLLWLPHHTSNKSQRLYQPAKPRRTWSPAPPGISSPTTHSLPWATRHSCCSLTCQVPLTSGFCSCCALHLEHSFFQLSGELTFSLHSLLKFTPLEKGPTLSKIVPH